MKWMKIKLFCFVLKNKITTKKYLFSIESESIMGCNRIERDSQRIGQETSVFFSNLRWMMIILNYVNRRIFFYVVVYDKTKIFLCNIFTTEELCSVYRWIHWAILSDIYRCLSVIGKPCDYYNIKWATIIRSFIKSVRKNKPK